MGTTEDTFQQLGNRPSAIDMLNSFAKDGAIDSAVACSILTEIPSGQLAFEASKDLMRKRISSSEHRRSSVVKDARSSEEIEC